MNDRQQRTDANTPPSSVAQGQLPGAARPFFSGGWLLPYRWLQTLLAALLWIALVYGLPLQTLRESRKVARLELTRLLQADRPDAATVLDAFDRATERVLFSAAGPYFILAVAILFLMAHLVAVSRRLHAAERDIRALRGPVS